MKKALMYFDGVAYSGTEEELLEVLRPHRGEDRPVVIDYTETTLWIHSAERAVQLLERRVAVDTAERAVEEVIS